MARGNQRDQAREKNQKNASKLKGGNKDTGYQTAKKSLTNAEIMRQKQADADAKKAADDEKKLQQQREDKAAKSNQRSS